MLVLGTWPALKTQKPRSSIRTADRQKRFLRLVTTLPASLHNEAIRSFISYAKVRDNLSRCQDNLSKIVLIPRSELAKTLTTGYANQKRLLFDGQLDCRLHGIGSNIVLIQT